MDRPQPQNEDSVKKHGDKLSGAAGARKPQAEPLAVARSEPPLKVHGDKLQGAVDKATS